VNVDHEIAIQLVEVPEVGGPVRSHGPHSPRDRPAVGGGICACLTISWGVNASSRLPQEAMRSGSLPRPVCPPRPRFGARGREGSTWAVLNCSRAWVPLCAAGPAPDAFNALPG
jgi:hypothetical protein